VPWDSSKARRIPAFTIMGERSARHDDVMYQWQCYRWTGKRRHGAKESSYESIWMQRLQTYGWVCRMHDWKTQVKTGGVKIQKKVLLQSYRDEFDILKLKKFNTPAAPGTMLGTPDKGEEILTPAKQTQCRSGVGKGMHTKMHYSRPDIMLCAIWRDTWRLWRKCTMTQCWGWWSMLMTQVIEGLFWIQWESEMGTRNTSSSLVVEAIPTMQKIRRRERASPDTRSYWKVHLWCLRARRISLLHHQFVRQSRQREYYVLKPCYIIVICLAHPRIDGTQVLNGGVLPSYWTGSC
jgi:hypothetical protein